MKLDADIIIGATYAGSKNTWKGKLTNLEYSMASQEIDVILPTTVDLPGAISIAGKFKSGIKVANITHEFVVNEKAPAHSQYVGVIHGKIEFEQALPEDIHNIVIELTDIVSPKPSEELLFKISDDNIEGIIEGHRIRTLQGRKKPGSGEVILQGHKKHGAGTI
jgi:hypothetical protein